MSANRLSWILVGVVVVLVGFLVFRTMQRDTSTRPELPSGTTTQATPGETQAARPPKPRNLDSLRAVIATRPRELSSVQRAKMVLKERGFYNGPIDGSFNQQVVEALKEFQKSVGMKPTGYLDEKTYVALGIPVRRQRP